MKFEIEINENDYGYIGKEKLKEAFSLLHDLYGMIWVEAFYDPRNDATCEYAQKLESTIRKVNDILHFKK